jgi:hypothetical protein
MTTAPAALVSSVPSDNARDRRGASSFTFPRSVEHDKLAAPPIDGCAIAVHGLVEEKKERAHEDAKLLRTTYCKKRSCIVVPPKNEMIGPFHPTGFRKSQVNRFRTGRQKF